VNSFVVTPKPLFKYQATVFGETLDNRSHPLFYKLVTSDQYVQTWPASDQAVP
jgi:hypothetical protein